MRAQNKSKMRLLCFLPQDADNFSEALRARWPTITIEYADYTTFQKGGFHEKEDWKDIPRYRSLGEAPLVNFHVFVRPEGWKPRWSRRPNRYGKYLITNHPRLAFRYDPSWFRNANGASGKKAKRPIDVHGGRIWARYDKDDKEVQRFLDAVWRIAAKLSTNVVDVLDIYTGEVNYPAQRTVAWYGHHALEWCRQDPDRTLGTNIRPVGTTTRPPRFLKHKPKPGEKEFYDRLFGR